MDEFQMNPHTGSAVNPATTLWHDASELPPSRFLLFVVGCDRGRQTVRLACYGRDFWDQGAPHYQDAHGRPLPASFAVSNWCSLYEVVADVDPALIHHQDLAPTFRYDDPMHNVYLVCAVGEERYRFAEMGVGAQSGFTVVGNAQLVLASDRIAAWVSLAELAPPMPAAPGRGGQLPAMREDAMPAPASIH